jgi:Bacteriophage head to tail connecting protein
MKTAAARFSALSVARNSVLEKAREASRLTIPGLIPVIGQSEHYSPTQPYQSAGAHGLRSLSARLLSTLFPTSVQFFRLELDAFAAAQLQADKNDVDTRLSQVAETTAAMMDDLKVRPALAEVIKQLIAAGNVVAYLPQDRAPRVYRIDQFVLKRDNYGQFTDIIQEKVWPSTLPEAVRTALGVKLDPNTDEKQIDVYTVVEQRDGKVTHWQEIEGKEVPGSKSDPIPTDQAGWLAPRWTVVPGSDYGRSHVTEYLGDLLSMDDNYKAITQFAAIASRVVTVVNPNSSLDVAELAAAESGDYIYGEPDTIQTLGLNKSQDFAVIKDVTATIEARVKEAFLVANYRDAERVTAEEIRSQSEELENGLGGTFSVLASELQQPIAARYLYVAAQRKLIPAIPEGIRPKIVTGLAALGRAAEVNRLRTFAADAIQILTPQVFASLVNAPAFLSRLGNEHGVSSLETLLKTEDQMAQEQQQAMAQQAMQAATPAIAEAAIGAATQDPNQGT